MKLQWLPFLLLAGLMMANTPHAAASDFTLNFAGLQSGEEVLNYYDGGTGSLGSGPGSNYGVSFTGNFVALSGLSPYGPGELGSLSGASAVMDVAGGMTGSFSFYYEGSGSAIVWSGLNGTGTILLDTVLAPETNWTAVGGNLSAEAQSVVFSGAGAKFDEITESVEGNVVLPEPASLLLAATGCGSLAAWWRRRSLH